eukprot:749642-Hanusia_phi.AAC.2
MPGGELVLANYPFQCGDKTCLTAFWFPQVKFDHPQEGFVFTDANNIMLAIKISHCYSSECGNFVIHLNHREVGKFHLYANEFGEIRTHVNISSLSDGEHVAAVKIVDEQGNDLGDHLYDDVGFFVDTAPREEEDKKELSLIDREIKNCPHAFSCSSGGSEEDVACSGHGACMQGACVCYANWAGDTCDHPIFENNTFIPDRDPSSLPSACVKSIVWENQTSEIRSILHDLSERTSCSPQEVLLFEVRLHHPSSMPDCLLPSLTTVSSSGSTSRLRNEHPLPQRPPEQELPGSPCPELLRVV